MKSQKMKQLWKEYRSLMLFILLMCVFRSAVADWNTVPTGSMLPTIVEGDRIWVNKMAYDLRIPFTHQSVKRIADPARGDIIVFDSEASDKRLVKRVVGVPGDTISMQNNVLYINGQAADYEAVTRTTAWREQIETLGQITHKVRLQNQPSSFSSFATVTVPKGHYLVLGDNRDNSADSRFIGFVPRQEIIGRTENVVLSLNYDNYYLPRQHRFWVPLDA